MAETGRLAVRGSLFVAAGNYIMQALSVGFSIVLTRLLTPEDFGVLALAAVVYSVFARLRQLGLDELLIARAELSDETIGTHLTLSTGLSVGAALLTFGLSPILAHFYSRPVIEVLQALALMHVFDESGIASTPRALLRKDLRFARLSVLDLASTLASLLVGIAVAWSGAGVWALVARDGAGIAFRSLGAWILVPRRPRWSFDRDRAREFLRQGWQMWISGTSQFVVMNYDDFVVGNMLGTASLGFYSRAYRYSKLPMSPLAPVYSVLAPTYARLAKDRARLSRTYALFLETVAVTAFPAAMLMAVAAPELVTVLLTDTWNSVAPLLRWLLPYALLRPIVDGSYSMAVALGMPKIVARIAAVEAVLMLVLCTALAWAFGVPGAAVSAAVVVLVGFVLFYLRFLREQVQVDYLWVFGQPCIALLAGAAAAIAVGRCMAVDSVVAMLVAKVAAGGTTFSAVLLALRGPHLLEQVRYVFRVGTGQQT